jgi:membrane associated rhomboid family serine protease
MFVTYGFLHAGALHFIVNMLTLWSLAPPVIERLGQGRFAAVYAAAMVGGAAGFAILVAGVKGYAAISQVTVPMVGASGALFGLAGALLAWELRDRLARRQSMTPVLRALGLLIGLNLVLWWAMNGHLAWQTHLGGFVAGWIAALAFAPAAVSREKTVRTSPHRTRK